MSNLIRIVPDKTGGLQRKTMEELREQKPSGNFIELINPSSRFPSQGVNTINDMIRTGAQGFLGGQEATPLQFQAAVGMADPLELNRLNINDYIIKDIDNPMSENYIDRGAGVGLNLVRNEINAERAAELGELENLDLNEFLAPGETGKILTPIEQTERAARLENIKNLVRKTGIKPMTDEEISRAVQLNKDYPLEDTKFQESVEVEVDNLLNKIKTEAINGIRYTYETLSNPIKREILTLLGHGVLADFLLNPGFSIPRTAFELGGELYNTGLKAYDTIKNMPYNILYNWFINRPRLMPGGKYSGMDGGEEYSYTEKDLDELETILRQEKSGDTPLAPEIKEALKDVKKVKEDIKYGGTAYEGEEKRKYYDSPEYRELASRLGKLYKDVTSYREGPLSGAGHIEPTGALTAQANSNIPMGININQRLTPAELKELKRRRKLQSKSIKSFYGEAPELNQSIEPAPTHNNNPTQGPIFDIPDSSPRQMQAAVLNPQDIINQMRASKQRKSKKVKQTSILGTERSTKESTKAETSRRV